jgi:hypothetical protein
MSTPDYAGKKLAVLVMGTDDNGEEEWVTYFGTAVYDGTTLFMDRVKDPPFEIRAEWLDRIEPVPDTVRHILKNADLLLRLTCGPLPPDADEHEYLPTGLKVPPE